MFSLPKVIFEAVTGSGNPPGYIALDDLTVFTNDSCETFPKTDPEATAGQCSVL